jgi:shikimate dehydrogenase
VNLDATTKLAAVIGSPVRHSLSPALHNAAFGARGANWVYLAFEVSAGQGRDALAAVRTLGIGGLSVTMPLKEEIWAALDQVDPAAQALRSVNTVVVGPTGELVGHSTDGAGFVDSLRLDAGVEPAGLRVVVLGAGGAARAVVDALARAEVSELVVVNRTVARADEAAALPEASRGWGSRATLRAPT